VTGNAFYMSVVTLIALLLCILIGILKKTGEYERSGSLRHKYYLQIREKGFLFGEKSFDLL